MGTSRGSSRSRLVVDNTVWASEAVGEEAVLAEFADETALARTEPTPLPPAPSTEPEGRPHRGLRLLSPHTPMKEVVRTVLIGCMSAMALGASFAIGFGYVWSDLAVIGPPAETIPSEGAVPNRDAAPPSSAPAKALETSVTERTAPASTQSSPVSEGRSSSATPQIPPSKPNERPAAAPPRAELSSDPGPAFGVPLQRPAPSQPAPSATLGAAPSVSQSPAYLASEPMVSAESATIPQPVAASLPSLSATPSVTRAADTNDPTASPTSAPHRSEVDAVRDVIGRYQSAYSQKDVGAMALVWPTVDVAGVARAFENVDKQALVFGDCRVTASGRFATAVCPGQVRYVGRVGGRQLQERHGTWTIALERNGDAWQVTRLNVR